MLPTTKYGIDQTLRTALDRKMAGVIAASSDQHSQAGIIVFTSHRDMVEKLFKKDYDQSMMLLHAVMGIAGEAGELVDAIKKHVFFGKELDKENVIEELGDILFYLEAMAQLLNVSKTQLMGHNVDKLLTGAKARHKSGSYSDEAQNARSDKQGVETEKAGIAAPTMPYEPLLPKPPVHNMQARVQEEDPRFPSQTPPAAPAKAPEPQPEPLIPMPPTFDPQVREYTAIVTTLAQSAVAKFSRNKHKGEAYKTCQSYVLRESLQKAVDEGDWASVVNYAAFLSLRG